VLTDADLDFAFRRALGPAEPEIDLLRAALLVAELEYPGLDVAAYVERVDELGALAAARPGFDALSSESRVVALMDVLFRELDYGGNEDDYYDPRNSFLNEVIDRRRGIPITLSVLVMEVAGRLGLKVDGIPAPGHFVVRHQGRLYDPFHRGRAVSGAELEALTGTAPAERLQPASKREIIARMLRNLSAIYQRNSDLVRLRRIRDRLAIVEAEPSTVPPVPSA
jgi:regulator of sirC expression with transglutaminase-like and TPR domain